MHPQNKPARGTRFLLDLIRHWFAFMVRHYPPQFRDEFQEEMEQVFSEYMQAEARRGLWRFLSAWLRELTWLPVSIVREFLHERSGRKALSPAGFGATTARPQLPATWGEALLAGLPHLAFSLFVGRTAFLKDINGNDLYNIFFGIPVLVGFLAAAFYAWRSNWPRWSASWFGYWLWIWFAIFANAAAWLNERLNLFVDWQFTIVLLAAMLLLLVVGLFFLFRFDRIMGLLAVFFLMPVGLPMTFMEFVPDRIEGLLALGSGLITALCAAWIIHDGRWRRGAWLALAGNLLMGIAYSYVQVFKLEPPLPGLHVVNPPDFFVHLFNFVLVSAILITGPFLFWNVWDRRNLQNST